MNQKTDCIVSYRNVKYTRIEVSKDKIKIVVPEGTSNLYVEELIKSRKNWIEEKINYFATLENIAEKLPTYEHENLEDLVSSIINECSEVLKVKPNTISFRKMKKWGSCNPSRMKINFSKNLKFLPTHLIRYVVIHELCHLIEPRHHKKFWKLVSSLDPNYKENKKLLLCYSIKLKLT